MSFLALVVARDDNEPVEMMVKREDGPTLGLKLQAGKGQREKQAELALRTNVRSIVHQALLGKR